MRHILLSLFATITFCTSSRGQTFALATQRPSAITSYSTQNFTAPWHSRARPGALTIVGISTAGVGCGVFFAGTLFLAFDYDFGNEKVVESTRRKGQALEIAGGALTAGGIGMLIAGVIKDRNKQRSRNGWGVIAPNCNTVGIAYNF